MAIVQHKKSRWLCRSPPSPYRPLLRQPPVQPLFVQTPPSTHPSPAAITANICSLFPWHLLSMTTLALGGGGVRMCVMRGGGCGLGHPSLNYRHSALSWGEYSTRKLHCQGCTLQEWLLISSGGLWSQTAGASKWAGVSSSFQISAKLSKAGIKWEKTSLMDACLVSWSPFTSTA